jgi:hypothetical protein
MKHLFPCPESNYDCSIPYICMYNERVAIFCIKIYIGLYVFI